MNEYALRCTEDKYPELLQLASMLSVLDITGEPFEKNGGIWDYIGYKVIPGTHDEGVITPAEFLKDATGKKYIHVNVRTPINVREVAESLAITNPEMAMALSKVSDYFVTDTEGQAKLPEFPVRIFL